MQAKKRKKGLVGNNLQLLALCIPAITGYILFHYVPIFGIVIAFKDYKISKGIGGSRWVGLKNFDYLFKSVQLKRILTNTVSYSFLFLIVGTVINLIVAFMLHEICENRGALKYYQTTMIFPNFMSWVVVGYITYALLNPSLGILNKIRENFGQEKIKWYSEKQYWPLILTIVNIWKGIGMGSMTYFAALIGIDKSLYEAASIDGATRIQQIRHISIPGIMPLISIQLILSLSGVFGGDFGLFYSIPRNQALLYDTTDIIETYIFRGLQSANYSASAAVGFVQSFVGMILLLIVNGVVNKISPENGLF